VIIDVTEKCLIFFKRNIHFELFMWSSEWSSGLQHCDARQPQCGLNSGEGQ